MPTCARTSRKARVPRRLRRTNANGPRTGGRWSFLERKVRCARYGQLMRIRTATEGPVVRVHFRCRKAAEGEMPCTGTQVRAYEIEQLVWSVLREPGVAFPRRRGRPARAMITLYSLGQFMPRLDPASERALAGRFRKLSGMPTPVGCKPCSNGMR